MQNYCLIFGPLCKLLHFRTACDISYFCRFESSNPILGSYFTLKQTKNKWMQLNITFFKITKIFVCYRLKFTNLRDFFDRATVEETNIPSNSSCTYVLLMLMNMCSIRGSASNIILLMPKRQQHLH